MTIRGAGLRTLSFICSKLVRRLHLPHPAAHHGSEHERQGKRRFPSFRVVSQLEQERRALQEGIDSAQRALDETLALIGRNHVRSSPMDAEPPSHHRAALKTHLMRSAA